MSDWVDDTRSDTTTDDNISRFYRLGSQATVGGRDFIPSINAGAPFVISSTDPLPLEFDLRF